MPPRQRPRRPPKARHRLRPRLRRPRRDGGRRHRSEPAPRHRVGKPPIRSPEPEAQPGSGLSFGSGELTPESTAVSAFPTPRRPAPAWRRGGRGGSANARAAARPERPGGLRAAPGGTGADLRAGRRGAEGVAPKPPPGVRVATAQALGSVGAGPSTPAPPLTDPDVLVAAGRDANSHPGRAGNGRDTGGEPAGTGHRRRTGGARWTRRAEDHRHTRPDQRFLLPALSETECRRNRE